MTCHSHHKGPYRKLLIAFFNSGGNMLCWTVAGDSYHSKDKGDMPVASWRDTVDVGVQLLQEVGPTNINVCELRRRLQEHWDSTGIHVHYGVNSTMTWGHVARKLRDMYLDNLEFQLYTVGGCHGP